MMSTQSEMMSKLVASLKTTPSILNLAQNMANAVVADLTHHCAATLSSLLIFAGIYPVHISAGITNLVTWVPSLVLDLQNIQGWTKINIGSQINSGDVGVVLVDANTHHIYLVIDPADQDNPLVADNQQSSFHSRPIQGDPSRNYSPTNFFLRAK